MSMYLHIYLQIHVDYLSGYPSIFQQRESVMLLRLEQSRVNEPQITLISNLR